MRINVQIKVLTIKKICNNILTSTIVQIVQRLIRSFVY